ncbi:hypothetical protein CHLRE_03g208945v5 [Chlamydomonas reinhardtii]|uniref:Uncharacterized protein n=1 Tax=Chlamydomonas reinhardtii TaxID=3055 RepID=A0A2K3DZV2_CHLRE|nr:uncharacterized protein CHLRE_03g208945v5 [Chlamydomonas reinhardtii]PNW86051.1 hypothetical protein CHLRE_03g208945v5 [Chlamydomonas reinhardtii]
MGSALLGTIAVTAYVTSLLGKRDLALKEEATQRVLADLAESTKRALALKEESTQRALADLEERRQREVNEQRARVEMLERVFDISYHSDWTGLRGKIDALKPAEPNKSVSGTGNGNGAGSAPGVRSGASAGLPQP